jgi:hypothetical protein
MWLGYMAVMLSLDRVMYLYHYFLPLVFSLALCAVTLNGERLAILRGSKLACGAAAVVLSLGTLLGFRAYAPLTYGHPVSDQKIASLALLKLWDLRCPSCELTNTIAKPVCNPKEFRFPRIRIGQVQASEAFQDWGEPVQDLSVEKQVVTIKGVKFSEVIGTHANSTIRFSIANKGYTSLTGRVGLPDYVSSKSGTAASVTFQVWLDGKMLWQSNRITPQDQLQEFSLSVAGGSQLELRTLDSGDGNNNDHAVWVEPRLM